MSTPGISCEVYVDKTRLADTADEYLASTPTALAGLSIVWGRSSVADQPDTSTCTLTVADVDGDADFLGLLHVGHTLDVYAAGSVSGGAPADVTVDGGFETTPVGTRARVISGAATLTLDKTDPYEGAQDLTVAASTSTDTQVAVPPAPYSTSTSAWAPIPGVTPGETWTVTVWVRTPAPGRHTVQLAAAIFASPKVNAPAVVGTFAAVPASSSWQQVALSITVPAGTIVGWVGLVAAVHYATWSATPGTWASQTDAWSDWQHIRLDDLTVTAPATAVRRALAFTGRITDISAQGVGEGVHVSLAAADWTADMSNTNVGDVPFLLESLKNRVNRVLALANASAPARQVSADVDAWPGGRNVTWRDVDSQPSLGLLQELATTGDAVMWSAFDAVRGFYLWFEDPTQRVALAALAVDGGSGLVVVVGTDTRARVILSGCDIERDPVGWKQDVTDVTTRIDLTWQEQTLDDQSKPAPTERTIQVIDTAAEDPEGLDLGVRRASYSTQLTTSADGTAVANRVLARSRTLGWHVEGVAWDTDLPRDFDDTDRADALTLLSGAKRLGCPIAITDLPAWSPVGDTVSGYVEGGTYGYESGRWTFELTVSPAASSSSAIKWNEIPPAYRWVDFAPSVRWLDMATVGA